MLWFGKGLEKGDRLPEVASVDDEGNRFDLGAYGREGFLLVFFFPKAETPGCVAQACSLRDAFAELSDLGVKVVGVSQDGVAAQAAFRSGRRLPYPLLADEKREVIGAFGVPQLLGLTKRQAYLFRDGELVWKDAGAATGRQAEDALAAIRGLGAE